MYGEEGSSRRVRRPDRVVYTPRALRPCESGPVAAVASERQRHSSGRSSGKAEKRPESTRSVGPGSGRSPGSRGLDQVSKDGGQSLSQTGTAPASCRDSNSAGSGPHGRGSDGVLTAQQKSSLTDSGSRASSDCHVTRCGRKLADKSVTNRPAPAARPRGAAEAARDKVTGAPLQNSKLSGALGSKAKANRVPKRSGRSACALSAVESGSLSRTESQTDARQVVSESTVAHPPVLSTDASPACSSSTPAAPLGDLLTSLTPSGHRSEDVKPESLDIARATGACSATSDVSCAHASASSGGERLEGRLPRGLVFVSSLNTATANSVNSIDRSRGAVLLGQSGVIDLTGQSGVIDLSSQSGVIDLSGQSGFIDFTGHSRVPGLLGLDSSAAGGAAAAAAGGGEGGDGGSSSMVRKLYDPANPDRPRLVTVTSSRRHHPAARCDPALIGDDADSMGYMCTSLAGSSSSERLAQMLERAADQVRNIISSQRIVSCWSEITALRQHVQSRCDQLLLSGGPVSFLRVSADQQVWRIFYHTCLEALRAASSSLATRLTSDVIDDGVSVFGRWLLILQTEFRLPVDTFGTESFSRSVRGHTACPPDDVTRSGQGRLSAGLALAQRLCLCLGDLTRYRYNSLSVSSATATASASATLSSTDEPALASPRQSAFTTAFSYYQQARRLNPKNGRPFNQLAIMSLFAHDRLGAVYYYCRALLASNSFQTAHESLLALFHESTKKHQVRMQELRPSGEPAARGQGGTSGAPAMASEGALRSEVWHHPGKRGRVLRSQTDDPQPAVSCLLSSLPDSQIYSLFVTSFLHVQGKLYTRINMERYGEDVCDMLCHFGELLSRQSALLTRERLLQIAAVVMFSIANTKLKDERDGDCLRSPYQQLALCTGLAMSSHVMTRCVDLLRSDALVRVASQSAPSAPSSPSTPLYLSPQLRDCICYIKVWCDWLLCSSSIWNPPPSTSHFRVRNVGDCWSLLADLTNILRKLDDLSVVFDCEPGTGKVLVRLPEDLMMHSFSPLICMDYEEMYTSCSTCDIELLRDMYRTRRILFVTEDFLCGTEPPALKLTRVSRKDTSSTVSCSATVPLAAGDRGSHVCQYVSAVETARASDVCSAPGGEKEASSSAVLSSDPAALGIDLHTTDTTSNEAQVRDASPPLPAEDDGLSATDDTVCNSAHLRRLQLEKLSLERRVRHQQQLDQRLQTAVSGRVKTVLEIYPNCLVADTNCYVVHLRHLVDLVSNDSPFSLAVPVVVLAELDGLAGSRGRQAPPHLAGGEHRGLAVSSGATGGASELRAAASAAVTFIRQSADGVWRGGAAATPGRGVGRRVRCVSTLGHVLGSTALTTELLHDQDQLTTNDDRIISCCLNMEREPSPGRMENNTVYLRRNVVLLTDDRNMRIKALSRDVVTRTVCEFVAWVRSRS